MGRRWQAMTATRTVTRCPKCFAWVRVLGDPGTMGWLAHHLDNGSWCGWQNTLRGITVDDCPETIEANRRPDRQPTYHPTDEEPPS